MFPGGMSCDEENFSLFKEAGFVARKMEATGLRLYVRPGAGGLLILTSSWFQQQKEMFWIVSSMPWRLFQESPAHLAGLREDKAMIDAADLISRAETE